MARANTIRVLRATRAALNAQAAANGLVIGEPYIITDENRFAIGTAVNGYETFLKTWETRERLTANRTYFVRADGSDSNTGLVNVSGGAFLTIQKAVDVAAALDCSIYTVTIQVVDGTYTGAVLLKEYVGANPISIIGDAATPANCLLSVTGNTAFTADGTRKYNLEGLKLQTATIGNGIFATNGAVLNYKNMEFGTVAAGFNHVFAGSNSIITQSGNSRITGGAANHMSASSGGRILADTRAFTLVGTPAFSNAFANAVDSASVSLILATFSGSATGKRYNASLNGVVNGGGGITLPGDSAGTNSTGGQYNS